MAQRIPLTGTYDHTALVSLTEQHAPLMFLADGMPVILESPVHYEAECQCWRIEGSTAGQPSCAVVVTYNAFSRTGMMLVM